MTTQNTPIQPAAKAPGLIKQVGFTLIELSIVLVIIGLIVGGVLVGQDLIKAAEIRATISQYEKYNAAINTFRTKYNAIPGDMAFADANAFGLNPSAGSLTAGGNGNGLIESTSSSNLNIPALETILFWQQLSAANLIDGSLGAATTAAGALGASPTPALYLPAAKSGRGAYWIVGSASGLNYYVLASINSIAATAYNTTTATTGGPLNPIDAFNVDSKLDDGLPNTGTIQARGVTAFAAGTDYYFPDMSATVRSTWTASPAATDCMAGSTSTGTSNTYARGTTSGSGLNCTLRLRFN